MKPKEFDELIRQKFDRNDFEYDSRNWDRLADQLDGRAKKRSVMMWWWMPLAGVAASVALAMGVTSFWRTSETCMPGIAARGAQKYNFERSKPVQDISAPIITASAQKYVPYTKTENKGTRHAGSNEEEIAEKFGINLQNAIGYTAAKHTKKIDLVNNIDVTVSKARDKKKAVTATEVVYSTFKEEEVKKIPKLTINLSGGVNHGNLNSGYMAGVTVRKMINDKVFVEGDVAFASSNNTESQDYMYYAGAKHTAGKTTIATGDKVTIVTPDKGVLKTRDVSYNLSYAQISPSVGCKIFRKISVAAGPDFQQVLADNRPAPATSVDFNNIAVAPLFDIGFVGKTEYSITKNIKAGVSYRKGINNILTPMDKYIDRDYLQFQVKCAIFNK